MERQPTSRNSSAAPGTRRRRRRRKLSPRKILRLVIIVGVIVAGCILFRQQTGDGNAANPDNSLTPRPLTPEEILSLAPRQNVWEARFDSMPPGGRKLKINYLGGTLGRVFNDSNHLHLEAATALGIPSVPSARALLKSHPQLVAVRTDSVKFVDDLTHSLPYLVPQAAALLNDIGAAFRDSLRSRGGGDYRIKVTSVLRTPATVSKLRRRNVNATENSAHNHATTFDISYSKFICNDPSVPVTQEDLKNLLAEVLFKFREEGRCYVKYERKQSCFHITARPPTR